MFILKLIQLKTTTHVIIIILSLITICCVVLLLGCPKGYFGKQCDRKCRCRGARCHRTFGICFCDAGRYGRRCHKGKIKFLLYVYVSLFSNFISNSYKSNERFTAGNDVHINPINSLAFITLVERNVSTFQICFQNVLDGHTVSDVRKNVIATSIIHTNVTKLMVCVHADPVTKVQHAHKVRLVMNIVQINCFFKGTI